MNWKAAVLVGWATLIFWAIIIVLFALSGSMGSLAAAQSGTVLFGLFCCTFALDRMVQISRRPN